jgi:hypothetical protein
MVRGARSSANAHIMADSNILILNQPIQRRTSKSGKARYTVNVKSEPLIHNLDAAQLGQGPAEAIAASLRKKVRGITQTASAATLRARATALAAFTRGEAWALKKYGGGRMGSMAPYRSDKAMNDSGRLAEGIVAQANKKEHAWTINVPANRLDETTARGGAAGVMRIWQQLVTLVPEFADARRLLDDADVFKSLELSVGQLIVKAQETRDMLLEQRAKAWLGISRQLMGALG